MSLTRYRLHGLTVDSEIALPAARVEPAAGAPDYAIVLGTEAEVPFDPPGGEVIAELMVGGQAYWASADPADPGRLTLRYGGVCEALFDLGGGRIELRPAAGGDRGVLRMIVAGSVMAHALTAAGHVALHASAAAAGGQAVAVMGVSGAGKTTVTAMMCAAGARLVSEDVLRCDVEPDRVTCFPGNRTLHLRGATAELAAAIPGADVGHTADGRIAVSPAHAEGPVPLAAIVLPAPSREVTGPELERLPEMEAALALISHPRLTGWRAGEAVRRGFEHGVELARRVPVYRAKLPAGPPFPPDIGAEMMRRVSPYLGGHPGPQRSPMSGINPLVRRASR